MSYNEKNSTSLKIKQLRYEMKCQVCLFGEELNRQNMSLFCQLKKTGIPYKNEVRCRDFVDKYKMPKKDEVFSSQIKMHFDEYL